MRHNKLGWWGGTLLVLAFIAAVRPERCYGNVPPPGAAVAGATSGSRPHCGLYCIYAVLLMEGHAVDFGDLLSPKYISSPKGSSLADLQRAAEHHGLYAVCAGRLTRASLISSAHRMILHVKSDMQSKEYDHYELFLGIEGERVVLFDPPVPPRRVPLRELVPRWDGTGLIVSAQPIHVGKVFAPARKRSALYVAAALVGVALGRAVRRRIPAGLFSTPMRRCRLAGMQVGLLTTAVLVLAFVYHISRDDGLLVDGEARQAVQEAHVGCFIPKVSVRQVRRLLHQHAIFIDARLSRDYESGHLEGALSLPVDANDAQWGQTLAALTRDTCLVVYCQSARCKFAEKVAGRLVREDFSNVLIFQGGWNAWVAENAGRDRAGGQADRAVLLVRF